MIRKAIIAALLALVASGTAWGFGIGLGNRFGDLGSAGSNTGWVLPGASIDLNFAAGQYFGCGSPPTDCLSITRASAKTDLVPSAASGFAYSTFGNNVLAITPTLGLLIEEARTNQLLNSTVPATQTTGSLANGTYTLWVNGSGTATMSAGTATGCGTGVASNGTPVNFTTSGAAGTCTVTVAGSLNTFQLELGAFGTSFIVTAGATATRAADNVKLIGSALSLMQGLAGTLIVSNGAIPGTGSFPEFWFVSASVKLEVSGSNTAVSVYDAGTPVTNSSAAFAASSKTGHSWDAAGRSISSHGSNAVTDATATSARAIIFLGSQSATTRFINTNIARLTLFSNRVSNTDLKALTQ